MTTEDNEILPQHVALNRARWDEYAAEYAAPGERSWALAPGEETWGIFGVPESELHLLPDDLEGLDAIELGCGTGYVSAWMTRRGARVVGIDNSGKQLETAASLQIAHKAAISIEIAGPARFSHGQRQRLIDIVLEDEGGDFVGHAGE